VGTEIAPEEFPDLRGVWARHERKALRAELSEGFIALPGGLGTGEEVFDLLLH
jgi:predicted Rossmann-fold nucleotide-binding protein